MYMPFMRQNKTMRTARFIMLVTICFMTSNSLMALETDRQQPIDIDAGAVDLDANTGFTLLTGDVAIDQGSLSIRSDEAEVYLQDSKPSRILLRGVPARWKQQLESGLWMEAEGKTIDYDVNSSTIVITGDAFVDHPQGTINGDKLTYNLTAESFTGQSAENGRIKMRLNPSTTDDIDVEGIGLGVQPNDNNDTQADDEPENPVDDASESNTDDSQSN